LPVGVTYHMARQLSSWDRDLQLMRDMGLNTVRADFGWRDVVPYLEGNYQFDLVDAFLDKALQYGLYVVPLFSYATMDLNTPPWFWMRYSGWVMVGADGRQLIGDFPSINHPDYRRLFEDYVRQTVRHIRDHPAVIAYQVMNELQYPKGALCDYNKYTVGAFRTWLAVRDPSLVQLNSSWSSQFASFADVLPPTSIPVAASDANSGLEESWRDWREFTYDNLGAFMQETADIVRQEDQNHVVLVSDFAYWWWGLQPITGVSASQIFRGGDVVGFDLYPDAGTDTEYYALTTDMLLRLWGRPVWVTELNRRDGRATSAEIGSFVARSIGAGATGIFYYEWRDNWTDGGAYGLLDVWGKPKEQFQSFAAAVRWLNGGAQDLLTRPLPEPDLYVYWPGEAVAVATGRSSPAYGVYRAALGMARQGLRVGVWPDAQSVRNAGSQE
ncbi:MAG: beta-galactosidase, partial [Dehalococcoidales bacterium]|nr:beta-galactosidase [Dehalococcoidales bacterium]